MKRLKNAHFGLWIDSSQTKQFTFEGKPVQGLEETVLPQRCWRTINGCNRGLLNTTVQEGH